MYSQLKSVPFIWEIKFFFFFGITFQELFTQKSMEFQRVHKYFTSRKVPFSDKGVCLRMHVKGLRDSGSNQAAGNI